MTSKIGTTIDRLRFSELLTGKSPNHDLIHYLSDYIVHSYSILLFLFLEIALIAIFTYYFSKRKESPSKILYFSGAASLLLAIYFSMTSIVVTDSSPLPEIGNLEADYKVNQPRFYSQPPLLYKGYFACTPLDAYDLDDLLFEEKICHGKTCFTVADKILFEGVSRVMNNQGEYFAVVRKKGGKLKEGIYLRFQNRERACAQQHLVAALCSENKQQFIKEIAKECRK